MKKNKILDKRRLLKNTTSVISILVAALLVFSSAVSAIDTSNVSNDMDIENKGISIPDAEITLMATTQATPEADSIQRDTLPQASNIIVIGLMDIMDASPEYKDFEITIIAVIIDGTGIHILKSGEMIRLYNFQGIEFASIVIGFCDDWGIIG